MKKLFVVLCLCLTLALSACGSPGTTETTESTASTPSYTVRFELMGTLLSEQAVEEGQLPEDVIVMTSGVRFSGWLDSQGQTVDPFTVSVTGDVTYQAMAYPALTGHDPYLFADSEGNLRPDDALTGDELLQALQSLAAEGAQDYFPAISTGTDAVTYSALCQTLNSFFDANSVAAAFPGEEDGPVTRAAFAQGMQLLLHRASIEAFTLAQDALLPTDVTQERPDRLALLEASVAHTPADEGTTWADVELPTCYAPGFVNIDGWLYYVQEDHYFLRDSSIGFLYFDANGRYTSGDAALDETVATILNDLISQNPDADRFTILREVYDYCHESYTYRRTYDHPAFGSNGWEIQRASAMFETGKGNCYSYAAIFWALSRGLGYQTRAISGTCLSDEQPHSWCIIELDGEDYFFDPEWQYAYTERGVFDKDMFKIPMDKIDYWGYKWSEPT